MTLPELQTFEPGGRRIPYVDEGEGVLVVLLPGRGLKVSSLGALAGVLSEEGFRVLRIGARRPSHGSDAGITMHDLAQDVVDVLDHLGIASAWVGGHAFGGAVARTVALDHPGRVEGLLLLGVEASESLPDAAARALQTAFSDAEGPDAIEAIRLLAGDSVDPQSAWNVFSRVRDLELARMQGSALAVTPAEEWAPLADRIPVSIVQGSDDRITAPANGEQLRASAPTRASIASIDGGGHLFPLTHPGEVGAEIEDYLGWD